MSSNLYDAMTHEAREIISDSNNWSKDFMPDLCALCKKIFSEDETPLILWAKEGRWVIQFHTKCAFGENVKDDSYEEKPR